ncbi:hypothetical protein [Xanthomonas maliensis]|uniref:hypothetical protein n=1 Tax=Xanthomonas maliensis TaxID=1321368 RepID=UPI0003A80043|nr:hypothetical protein [Xanthomonas maliensis]KAB7771918.1 hypothetical protein CKY51_02560 [Xanthomonas maliensis]
MSIASTSLAHRLAGPLLAALLVCTGMTLAPLDRSPAARPTRTVSASSAFLPALEQDLRLLEQAQRRQLRQSDALALHEIDDERLGSLRQRIARHVGYLQASPATPDQAQRLVRLQTRLGQYLALQRQIDRALHAGDLAQANTLSAGQAGTAQLAIWQELHGLRQALTATAQHG